MEMLRGWADRMKAERHECQFVDQMGRPPTSQDSIRSAAHANFPSHLRERRFRMHCIGVDVSKQELVTSEGTKERIFPNTRGLTEFGRFLKRSVDTLVVFEPTSTYSRRLETLCRTRRIPCCPLNPRVVPHLRQVGKGRSKTDSMDAELLYRYGIERGHTEAAQLGRDSVAESVQARLACYRVAQKARVAYQGVVEALSQDSATPQALLPVVDDLRTPETGRALKRWNRFWYLEVDQKPSV